MKPAPTMKPALPLLAAAIGAALAVTVLSGSALAAPAAPGPASPAACRSVQLPTIGAGETTVNGGDPTGRYLVTAINDRGDVVGYDQDQRQPSVRYHAVVWPGGNRAAVRELSLPGEGTTDLFAAGIDEDGTVLGTRGNPTDAVPYVWPAHGAAYQLTAPAGTTRPVGNAIRITDTGVVAAGSGQGIGPARLWLGC
jgi:hypothetical protein